MGFMIAVVATSLHLSNAMTSTVPAQANGPCEAVAIRVDADHDWYVRCANPNDCQGTGASCLQVPVLVSDGQGGFYNGTTCACTGDDTGCCRIVVVEYVEGFFGPEGVGDCSATNPSCPTGNQCQVSTVFGWPKVATARCFTVVPN